MIGSQRVLMKQRGGFVPNEVTYPARSRETVRTPFARTLATNRGSVRREMRSDSPGFGQDRHLSASALLFFLSSSSLLSTPRVTGDAVRRPLRPSERTHTGLRERAGYVTSLGTKPPLCHTRTLC